MANPFTSPSLSGFNVAPPPDDGSQNTANQLKWSNHIVKIGTPLRNYIDDLVTNANLAFATVDNAANLVQGILPDARLPANIPRLNAANVFTGTETLASGHAFFLFDATGSDLNERQYALRAQTGLFAISNYNDEGGFIGDILAIQRTASNVDSLALVADSITANGSEVLTPAEVAAATDIEGNALASTDGFYVDDAGIAKRMSYSDSGLIVRTTGLTARTFLAADMNSYWITTSAAAVTLTLNTGVGKQGNILIIKQGGAGQVSLAGTATLEGALGTKTRALNSVIALVNEGSDVWSVSGDATT